MKKMMPRIRYYSSRNCGLKKIFFHLTDIKPKTLLKIRPGRKIFENIMKTDAEGAPQNVTPQKKTAP